jgi:Flp pilus assembly protein TadG
MNRASNIGGLGYLFRDLRGATAVEFALVAPILFAIIFGTIDLGRYAWTLSTIQNAADEAARQGGVRGYTATQAQTVAQNNLFSQSVGDFTVAATFPAIAGVNYLQVQITHTYDFMFPISIFQSSGTMTVTSQFPRP